MNVKKDIIMDKILLAGATGYLGKYILRELILRGYNTKAIVRNSKSFDSDLMDNELLKVINAQVTKIDSLNGCCENVDTIISTVGITKQKDGLTYMDVDYQANMNLLEEAKKNGVKKFIYISVFIGEKLKHLKICEAKEKFVEALKQSGLEYCIIHPNGFFSDMTEFYNMAKKGRIYLFGDGNLKANPIHGEDLAKVVVDSIEKSVDEIKVGGPEILTQNQIADISFQAAGKKKKVSHISDWIRVFVLKLIRMFTGSKTYGPIEFFLTVMAMDMIAPEYGSHTLKQYFNGLNNNNK